jgi:hypothetical protein
MKNYKKRMIKEYRQLTKRANKLRRILIKFDAGTLEFEPDTPIWLLREQYKVMCEYIRILEIRAEIEGVDLY